MKKSNWRPFFTDFRGNRLDAGHSEEQRYQAFKARFLHEQAQAEERARYASRTPSPYDLSALPQHSQGKP